MLRTIATCIAALAALPAVAQDIPSPYDNAVAEFGQRQMMDRLAKRRLDQAQQRQSRPGRPAISARSRAICRDKRPLPRA